MDEADGGFVSPRVGSYIIGCVNFVASFLSIFIVKAFNRKSLLIIGHIAMGVCHLAVAICKIMGIDIGIVVMINLFLVSYEFTSGPITWIYTSEVVVDSALGFCILNLWGTVLILSLTTTYMMNSFL